jgi:hypothetical protein
MRPIHVFVAIHPLAEGEGVRRGRGGEGGRWGMGGGGEKNSMSNLGGREPASIMPENCRVKYYSSEYSVIKKAAAITSAAKSINIISVGNSTASTAAVGNNTVTTSAVRNNSSYGTGR